MPQYRKFYKVRAKYPSGYVSVLPITVSPGDTQIVVERAVKRNGELLDTVTIEPKDEGGYICVETGEVLYLKRFKLPLINSMERACFYVKMNCKNKLSKFSVEYPVEVEPAEIIEPDKIIQQIESGNLAEEEALELMQKIATTSIVGALSEDPKKI